MAHELDNDTVGLWRFNTITGSITAGTVTDNSGNGLDLSQGDSNSRVCAQGALGGVTLATGSQYQDIVSDADLCAWVYPDTSYLINSNPGTTFLNNIRDSSWGFETWIYLESSNDSTALNTLDSPIIRLAPLAGGFGNANNEFILFFDVSESKFFVLYDQGNKDAQVINTSTTASLQEWHHVAATFEITGSDWYTSIYIDGVLDGSGTNPYPQGANNDYDNADIVIGRNFDNSARFHGGIGSIAMHDYVRTADDIYQASLATDTRVELSSSHFALWNFQELPAVYDHSSYGNHLVPYLDTSNPSSHGVFGVLCDGGYGAFSDSSNGGYKCPKKEILYQTFSGSSEWSVEMWYRKYQGLVADVGIMSYGLSGEDENVNYLSDLFIDASSTPDNQLKTLWESGTGTDISSGTSVSAWTNNERYNLSLHHLGIVKRNTGSTASYVDFYVDGSLLEAVGPLNNPTGGNSQECLFTLMRSSGAPFYGYIDDIKLSNVAKTASDISSSYASGLNKEQTITIETTINSVPTGSFDRQRLRKTYPAFRRRPRPANLSG